MSLMSLMSLTSDNSYLRRRITVGLRPVLTTRSNSDKSRCRVSRTSTLLNWRDICNQVSFPYAFPDIPAAFPDIPSHFRLHPQTFTGIPGHSVCRDSLIVLLVACERIVYCQQ